MKAYIHIQASLRNGITYLKQSYFTPPFKVVDITENKSENTLRLMLMSSSPGILDEDEYKMKIEVAEDCSVELQTQSYQRLFNMKKSALQYMDVYMAEGASFIYLPHPAVPHESSNFTGLNKIYLNDNCHLIWGEVLTCGRKLSGEAFRFSKYHSLTEIFLNGRLVVKENLLVQPSLIKVNAIGQLEGYTHQASLIFLDETASVNASVDQVNEWLILQDQICFGVSALSINGVVVRLLGYKAEQLYECLKMITTFFLSNKVNNKITTENSVVYAG